ncbi:MAG: GNAT family N-acetyltransferase [Prevotella sp.]|nr:GNAT family N-acetyltransferase [Prevotella sp.]
MNVSIFQHASQLPPIPAGSYFHSPELMELCERTPRHKPYMVVVQQGDGTVAAHLLAIVRYRHSWFPPYLYMHVRMMGEGEYHIEGINRQELFGLMAEAITTKLQNRTLYMEFSHLSEKMFGYRELRKMKYFPVRWMSVHNSLHSRTPEERITERQLIRIENALNRGATTKEVQTDEEFRAFSRLLRHHNWFKPRRYLPDDQFFRGMMESGHCKIFITLVHEHVIGCSVCIYSGSDAYLWYSASRRKSFAPFHPNAVTFWNTIKDAHASGYDHIRFIDVGLPFRKNPYRDFILRFGGKEVSTYRWFRISIRWVNKLASWLWRE